MPALSILGISSDESGYDSEEEQRQQRQQSLAHGRAVQRHAQQQREKLRASTRRANMGWLNGGAPPDGRSFSRHQTLAKQVMSASEENELRLAWVAHESGWAAVASDTQLDCATLPWPPNSPGSLAGAFGALHDPDPLTLQQHHLLQHGCWAYPPSQEDQSQMRVIFRQAARRWHPDKISPRIQGRSEECARAIERIQTLVQSINEEWESLNAQFSMAADNN
ncbi:hypothetical protein WJX84_005250 [Apatococcus fuscideae]|uniref:J domain-containing protein n=1 Tax=Apatococcus fuscideae TaxID=2026836 RepID=A0AAW1SW49_9CHLO